MFVNIANNCYFCVIFYVEYNLYEFLTTFFPAMEITSHWKSMKLRYVSNINRGLKTKTALVF